jgi:hypothetical protein
MKMKIWDEVFVWGLLIILLLGTISYCCHK